MNPAWRDRASNRVFWFAFMAGAVFCGEALGYAASFAQGAFPPRAVAWGAFAAVAVAVGGIGAVLLNWLVLDRARRLEAEATELRRQAQSAQASDALLATRAEQQRRLRHDIRGALSPAMLMSDRLLANTDPTVRRAGEVMIRCVDRATALLADPDAVASPPADP